MKLQTLTAILITFGIQAACLQPGVRAPMLPPDPNAPANVCAMVYISPTGVATLNVWGESEMPCNWECQTFTMSYGVRKIISSHTSWRTHFDGIVVTVDRCAYGAQNTYAQIFVRDGQTDALIAWNEAFVVKMY